jgi:hypothetical protein
MNTDRQLIITRLSRLYTLVDRARNGDEQALEILKNNHGIRRPELFSGVILGLKMATRTIQETN